MAYAASSRYNKTDLDKVQDKAKEYVQKHGTLHDIDYFIRDKTLSYYDDIVRSKGGKMEPYMKDRHGDPKCPVSNVVKGLFFSPLDSLNASISFYGNRRFKIEASTLVEAGMNAYFADFYCIFTAHYITIVLTKPGSEADDLCKSLLLEVDLADNPFLTRDVTGRIRGIRGYELHVELLYTADINVITTGTLTDITPKNMASVIRNPRSKNSNCVHCNINRPVLLGLRSSNSSAARRSYLFTHDYYSDDYYNDHDDYVCYDSDDDYY